MSSEYMIMVRLDIEVTPARTIRTCRVVKSRQRPGSYRLDGSHWRKYVGPFVSGDQAREYYQELQGVIACLQ